MASIDPDVGYPDKEQKKVEVAYEAEGLGELEVNLAVGQVKVRGFGVKEAVRLLGGERLESLAKVFELENFAIPRCYDCDERRMLKNYV